MWLLPHLLGHWLGGAEHAAQQLHPGRRRAGRWRRRARRGRRPRRPAAQPGAVRTGPGGRLGPRRRRQPGRDQPADLVRGRGGPRRRGAGVAGDRPVARGRRPRRRRAAADRPAVRRLPQAAGPGRLPQGLREPWARSGSCRSTRPTRRRRRPRRSAAAAGSMVKITGVARSCSRSQEGSGWVVAPGRVVTNAHVVAGEHSERVRVGGVGPAYAARVVRLRPRSGTWPSWPCPGLTAPALKLGADVGRGTSAVVAGFPQNGPYTVGAGPGAPGAAPRPATTSTAGRASPGRSTRSTPRCGRATPAVRCWTRRAGSSAWCSPRRSTTRTPATR